MEATVLAKLSMKTSELKELQGSGQQNKSSSIRGWTNRNSKAYAATLV